MNNEYEDSFVNVHRTMDFDSVSESLKPDHFTDEDVIRALDESESCLTRGEWISERAFSVLISGAAAPYIEQIAVLARGLTRKRFGNTMLLYAPLYLSSECRSVCTYCGFSRDHSIPRITLNADAVQKEAESLSGMGIRHILLLTGEDYKSTSFSYISDAAKMISDRFPSIGIEVYALKEEQYREIRESGVDALTIYQETYNPHRYKEVHLAGIKSRMEFRLDAPDRAGKAGFRKITIGALVGLSDAAADVFYTGIHARYLLRRYWKTQIQVSLPRLRPASGVNAVPLVSDPDYVRYLCALRLFLPDAGIVLSTRETAELRDSMAEICITAMSAASRTDPGGYSLKPDTASENRTAAKDEMKQTGQFAIEDDRSVSEIQEMLISKGIEPVFTDWTYILK